MAELQQQRTKYIRRAISRFITDDSLWPSKFREMIQDFRRSRWNAFLFGGTPRGIYHKGARYLPRDLDIVLEDSAFREFASIYKNQIQRRTRFGGLRLSFHGVHVDAWPLSKTWAFREGFVKEVAFERLPQTTFLNIDAIAVELSPGSGKARRIFDSGFFSAYSRRLLDINLAENPQPVLAAIRSLRLAETLGFDISNRLAHYISDVFHNVALTESLKIQKSHYGTLYYDVETLESLAEKLQYELNHNEGRLALFGRQARQQLEFWVHRRLENEFLELTL